MNWPGIMEHYKDFLPVSAQTPRLTLMEGNTPLIYLAHLSERLGVELYGKVEGANPTGSFKDRGMALAVAKAMETGDKAVICASTGNTSASAAAYAAKAGMQAVIVIPKGKIARGKLAQAKMHGAEIVEIEGNFDEALGIVRDIAENSSLTLVNSLNPHRLDGQQTAAFEICDELGAAPDVLAIPVGNAGNISAYWKGFKTYNQNKGTGRPQMEGFEAEGAAAMTTRRVIQDPETVATAIRIGNPASWELATDAAAESAGHIGAVSDDAILEAHQLLAREEGIFAEPASCASITGVMNMSEEGRLPAGSKIVAVLTGNGLKDPDTATEQVDIDPVTLPNDEKAITDYILKVRL